MKAEEFEKQIVERFGFIDDFIHPYEKKQQEAFLAENGIELVETLDEENYDSYGSEDSTLRRIYKHHETSNLFEIYGRRSSYGGTEWYGIKDVELKTKQVHYYE